MEIIKHRANNIAEIDNRYGYEIDVRDSLGELIISHDPSSGNDVTLSEYFKYMDKSKLIGINVKSSEIEHRLKKTIQDSNISNYFTFDWTVPSLIKAIQAQLVCAFRLSEYEKEIMPNCSWVWVDAFHKIWYDAKFLEHIHNKGIKIALVSPEIHERTHELKKIKDIVNTGFIDAICTDMPEYYL